MKKKIAAIASAAVLSLGLGGTFVVQQASAAPQQMSVQAASAMPVLRSGSKGTAVKLLQRSLAYSGVPTSPDSSFGPATLKSVQTYQKKKGLNPDGIVGPATWGKLLPVLKPGSKGAMVKTLQLTLNDRGAKLAVDGSYGPGTVNAVKNAQGQLGLAKDGITGPNTWAKLAGGGGGGTQGSGPDTRYAHPKRSGKYSNGKLPSGALCRPSFSPQHQVACYMLPDLEALNRAYKARFGVVLDITEGPNAYRNYATQVDYYNRFGYPRAARPGTSNHGWGLAVDLYGLNGYGGTKYQWLNANAGRYGFDDNTPKEAWHWEYER